ncbi:MAG: YbdD/YjiX family protein [Gemmatimonadaceae bacterium]
MSKRAQQLVDSIARTLRAMLGVPDYDRYLEHQNANHRGCVPMTRAEFAAERLESRYNKPGSRCC